MRFKVSKPIARRLKHNPAGSFEEVQARSSRCHEREQLYFCHPRGAGNDGFLSPELPHTPRGQAPRSKPYRLAAATCSCGNRNALHTNELQILRGLALYFKAKLNRLPNPLHQLIQRFGLCVTSRNLRHRCDVNSLRIAFNYNVVLMSHRLLLYGSQACSALAHTSLVM